MGALVRSHDWSASRLGPVSLWPQSLRSAISICLGANFPIALYWGPECCLLYNDAWSPILGSKHPAALGRRAEEVWPEIWATIGPMLRNVLSTGEATRSKDQLLAMHRHGFTEECYFDYTFSPIRDEAGEVGGIFNAVVETTLRVIGERRTRLLRELGTQTANAQEPQAVAAAAARVLATAGADLPFCLIYLSEAGRGASGGTGAASAAPLNLAAATGIEPARAELALWSIGPGLSAGAGPVVTAVPQHLTLTSASYPWPERCGQALGIALAGDGQRDGAGLLIAGLSPRLALDADYRDFMDSVGTVIARALSRSRAFEHERNRARELAELDRAKTTFFSNISHELRTPLTLIIGPLQDLLRGDNGPLDASVRAPLDSAYRSSRRLLKLVNALLEFSRIEAGRTQAQFEAVDIVALTRSLVRSFQPAIRRAGLDFRLTDAPMSMPVSIDRNMWEAIVLNLLSNALKYTWEGSISVDLRQIDDALTLSVSDTGIGIPPEEVPNLFKRFHRVPNAHGRTHEGSGIGLALVQEFVQLHGGSIGVESQVGVGSTFTVRIVAGVTAAATPTTGVEAGPQRNEAEVSSYLTEAEGWVSDRHEPEPDGTNTAPWTALRSGPRAATPAETQGSIVLADDNADMREYLRRLLARRFRVRTAADGEQALRLVRQELPDLVLTDIMMPKLDGFGLLHALRAEARTRELPVILLSARAGEEATLEGLEASAEDYLVKPFSARELMARVGAHITVARMRSQSRADLQAADRRKDEFLVMLAHELRSPLAPIRQAARLASMPAVTAAQLQNCCDIINRQTRHIAILLEDLLDVSRIAQGKLELRKAPIELRALLGSAIETAQPLIEARGHTLLTEMPEEPVVVVVDALRVSQVITNLLTNAAKYTDEGGQIRLGARQEEREVIISVTDNGIGIAADKLEQIFRMYSQVQAGAERSGGGLGIGLALVNGLVALHGGTVRASSAGLGQGSEFTIRLPTGTEN